MEIIALKCPGCNADIELDKSREFGFCTYCGTKVLIERNQDEDEEIKYEKIINIANEAYINKNYAEAFEYYTHSLELCQDDYFPFFRKGICAGYLSEGTRRLPEVSGGIRKAFDMATDDEKKQMSSEIQKLVFSKITVKTETFANKQACLNFANKVLEQVRFMDAMYYFIDKSDGNTVMNYSGSVVEQCDSVGKTVPYRTASMLKPGMKVTSFYIVPDSIRNEMGIIRSKFAEINNGYMNPKVNKSKADYDIAVAKLSSLPSVVRILHTLYSLPSYAVTIVLLMIYPLAGLIFLGVQIISFLLFTFVFDSDKSAKEKYEEVARLRREYYGNKKNIK